MLVQCQFFLAGPPDPHLMDLDADTPLSILNHYLLLIAIVPSQANRNLKESIEKLTLANHPSMEPRDILSGALPAR